MPAPPQYPAALAEAAARATAEASRQWEQSATAPSRGRRIVKAATLAWDAAYPIAYTHGYTTLANRAAAAFHDLHQRPDAQHTAVRQLIEVAQSIHSRLDATPPPPRRVLELAAIAVMDRLDGRTAPEAITQTVHREAVKEGGVDGALTAADDINAGWRARTDSAVLVVPIGELTLEQRMKVSLATLNRDFITGWVADAGEAPVPPAALAGASFAAPAAAIPVAVATVPARAGQSPRPLPTSESIMIAVDAVDVARELTSRPSGAPGPPPVAGVAGLAAAAWNGTVAGPANAAARRRATMAVIDAVYPHAAAAGERGGTQAVAQHIAESAGRATAALGESNDPSRVTRDLLGRLSFAAHTEARFGTDSEPRDVAHPLTTSYQAALGDLRDDTDTQRAATAAQVAWTHGYRDGWREAYWSANRIINTVWHDEIAATTVIDGVPALTWIDDLAESARQIANERPSGGPARLARLAGSGTAPTAVDGAGPAAASGPAPTHRSYATDKDNRRPRGM